MGKKRINNPIIYCFGKKRQRALLRGRVLSKGFGYWRGVFSYSERTTLILAKKRAFYWAIGKDFVQDVGECCVA